MSLGHASITSALGFRLRASLAQRRFPVMRRAAYLWFVLWLRHLPAARACTWCGPRTTSCRTSRSSPTTCRHAGSWSGPADLVLAHSESALAELGRTRCHGSPRAPSSSTARLLRDIRLASRSQPASVTAALAGSSSSAQCRNTRESTTCLRAFAAMPDDMLRPSHGGRPVRRPSIAVHGCANSRSHAGARVTLRLEHVPEDEVAPLFGARRCRWCCPSGRSPPAAARCSRCPREGH